MDHEPLLDRRGRRAIPIMAAALTVIVVACLLWLRATAPPPRDFVQGRGAPPFAVLSNRFAVAYDFITPSLGWAGIVEQGAPAKAWVYRTTDGARHWQKQFINHPLQGEAPWIRFFDRDHGFFYAGELYGTADGGRHWTVISLPDATPSFTFASPKKGWAADYAQGARLYATDDGGLTWRALSASLPVSPGGGKGPLMPYDFRSSDEGWVGAITTHPTVYLTLDGGASWRAVTLPVPKVVVPGPPPGKPYLVPGPPYYSTAVMLLPGNGVLVVVTDDFGDQLSVTSFDGGGSWRTIPPPPAPNGFSDLSFVDAQHWWASRWNVLYKTSDAGQTWTPVTTADPDVTGDWTFEPAQVIDARHAWLRMDSTTLRTGTTGLAMTSDGGVHWAAVNAPQPA